MKKGWILLAAVVMTIAMAACGKQDGMQQAETQNENSVNATQPEMTETQAQKEENDAVPAYDPEVGLTLPEVPEYGPERETVEVADGDALQALFSESSGLGNVAVILADGTYKLSYPLNIRNCENVSLIGTGKTRIILDNGEGVVINAFRTKNLLLYGLTMGHEVTPTAECTAGVLSLFECEGATVIGCDLFGCGLLGIHTDSNVTVQDSVIRDCSDGAAKADNGCTVHFINSVLQGNRGDALLWGSAESTFIFDDCVIQDNSCTAEYYTLLGEGELSIEKNNTVVENNAWQ